MKANASGHVYLIVLLSLFLHPLFGYAQSIPSKSLPPDFPEMQAEICDSPEQFKSDGCTVCPPYMEADLDNHGMSFTITQKVALLAEGDRRFFQHQEWIAIATQRVSVTNYYSGKNIKNGKESLFFISGVGRERWPGETARRSQEMGRQKDLLICNYSDWGAGGVYIIELNDTAEIGNEQELLQRWVIPFRESSPSLCSYQTARLTRVTSRLIELSVETATWKPNAQNICDDFEAHGHIYKALFFRQGDQFLPDETTSDLLNLIGHRP